MEHKPVEIAKISTKYLVRKLLMNIQLNIGSKNFITEMGALKMRRVADIFLWLMKTN